jgi:hypothetical protein
MYRTTLLPTVLDGVSGQRQDPDSSPPGNSSGNHWTGGWEGPRVGLNAFWRRQTPLPSPRFEPRLVIVVVVKAVIKPKTGCYPTRQNTRQTAFFIKYPVAERVFSFEMELLSTVAQRNASARAEASTAVCTPIEPCVVPVITLLYFWSSMALAGLVTSCLGRVF